MAKSYKIPSADDVLDVARCFQYVARQWHPYFRLSLTVPFGGKGDRKWQNLSKIVQFRDELGMDEYDLYRYFDFVIERVSQVWGSPYYWLQCASSRKWLNKFLETGVLQWNKKKG